MRRFVTDFRYVEQAKVEVPDFDREQGPQELLAALGRGCDGVKRLGFDDGAPVRARAPRASASCCRRTSSSSPAAGVVEEVRAVKEPGEILRIGAAAALVDEIYALAARVRAGRAHRARRRRGAGARDAPARRVGPVVRLDRRLGRARRAAARDAARRARSPPDTLVTLDIGAVLDGYCSDCTRTWATGASVPDELAEIYALALRAQVTSLDAVRPGPLGREIDAIARDIIDAAGHGEHFGHGLGHGVGLVTHEAPRLARSRHRAAGRRATS